MHIGIGEETGHLAEEALDELVSLLAGRIKSEVGDAELAADRIGGAIAGKLRVSDEPRRAVARHLKLRHDANTACASIADNLGDILLGVVEAIRPHDGELREELAIDAEALVLGKMPVEDVELDCGHAVERTFEHIHRFEVASAVNHEAPPWEAWRIADGDSGQFVFAPRGLHQLHKRLQAANGSDDGSSLEVNSGGRDRKRIGLVFVDRLNLFARSLHRNRQLAASSCRGGLLCERKPCLLPELPHTLVDGSV